MFPYEGFNIIGLRTSRTGSHRKWYNPKNEAVVPIPDWDNKDLKLGTLRQIIRQLDLDWEEFKHL